MGGRHINTSASKWCLMTVQQPGTEEWGPSTQNTGAATQDKQLELQCSEAWFVWSSVAQSQLNGLVSLSEHSVNFLHCTTDYFMKIRWVPAHRSCWGGGLAALPLANHQSLGPTQTSLPVPPSCWSCCLCAACMSLSAGNVQQGRWNIGRSKRKLANNKQVKNLSTKENLVLLLPMFPKVSAGKKLTSDPGPSKMFFPW